VLKVPLVLLMTVQLVLPLRSDENTAATVQRRVAQLPTGKFIEVKFNSKERKPIRGRLSVVTTHAFEVEVTRNSSISNVTVPFDQVETISEKRERWSRDRTGWTIAAVGMGVLVVVVALGAIVAFG
jgi:hypothetical protein